MCFVLCVTFFRDVFLIIIPGDTKRIANFGQWFAGNACFAPNVFPLRSLPLAIPDNPFQCGETGNTHEGRRGVNPIIITSPVLPLPYSLIPPDPIWFEGRGGITPGNGDRGWEHDSCGTCRICSPPFRFRRGHPGEIRTYHDRHCDHCGHHLPILARRLQIVKGNRLQG